MGGANPGGTPCWQKSSCSDWKRQPERPRKRPTARGLSRSHCRLRRRPRSQPNSKENAPTRHARATGRDLSSTPRWSAGADDQLTKRGPAARFGAADTQRTKASPGAAPRALGLTLCKERLVLFLLNADGAPLFDSFVHPPGGTQAPGRHASEPRGICTQRGSGCGDFIGVIDNRVGGGRAVIEIPKFELASDRLDKLGGAYLEGRGRLLFRFF